MKIIGILMAWACEDWIEYAIIQALDLVDELIICIGPFHKYFKNVEDDTFNKAKKYFDNKKVKVIKTICEPDKTPDENRCATANYILQISENIDIGNIIWIFDADEYYSKAAIKEIMNFIRNNDFDLIYVKDLMFCINFNYYITFKHERILKIKNLNFYYKPPQRVWPRPKNIINLLEKNPMFHYSMLMGEQMKGIQWMLENIPNAVVWYKKIYNKYDPMNEDYWMQRNQGLTGNYGFWRNRNEAIIEKSNGGLFRYYGKHPEIIENSPLRLITDFRDYMKKKPNYKQYINTMKEIIAKQKKFDYKVLLYNISKSKLWRNYFFNIKRKLEKKPIFEIFFDKIPKYTKM